MGKAGEVGEFKVVKDMPRMDEAMVLLQKLHSLCKPIQKKHGWYLPTLTEFFPSQECLHGLNQNRGQAIFIRLRPAHDKSSFLPLEESLVGTLLHEFTHNVRGPHDKQFYDFLDGLQDEYDELRRGGYSGEGFFSDGKRAGINTSHNLTPDAARAKAVKEAERRRQLSKVMGPVGGSRLGGTGALSKASSNSSVPRLSPREMAALAAERRRKDAVSCGHGDGVADSTVQQEMDKAMNSSTTMGQAENQDPHALAHSSTSNSSRSPTAGLQVNGTARSNQDAQASVSDDSDIEILEPPAKLPRISQSISAKGKMKSPVPSSSRVLKIDREMQEHPSATPWTCKACTHHNERALALACEMCGTERYSNDHPESAPSPLYDTDRADLARGTNSAAASGTWTCLVCEAATEHQWWTCRLCGQLKPSS